MRGCEGACSELTSLPAIPPRKFLLHRIEYRKLVDGPLGRYGQVPWTVAVDAVDDNGRGQDLEEVCHPRCICVHRGDCDLPSVITASEFRILKDMEVVDFDPPYAGLIQKIGGLDHHRRCLAWQAEYYVRADIDTCLTQISARLLKTGDIMASVYQTERPIVC